MAQCKLSPHEYIQNAFAPQVAILCSEDADNLCLKNNLRFVELIQPFCRLNSESTCVSSPRVESCVRDGSRLAILSWFGLVNPLNIMFVMGFFYGWSLSEY